MKKISQREARCLRRRVEQLENQARANRNRWSKEWVGGITVTSMAPDAVTIAKVETARALGHAVVVTSSDGRLYFHALPQDPTEAKTL